jgi:hypothetical protein
MIIALTTEASTGSVNLSRDPFANSTVPAMCVPSDASPAAITAAIFAAG